MSLPPPTVVNLRQGQEYDEYIGLGSRWGNPYANGVPRARAIRSYETLFRDRLKDAGWKVDLRALSGKRLGCHCAPKPCHGDVLVKLFLEFFSDPGKMGLGDPCAGNNSTGDGS